MYESVENVSSAVAEEDTVVAPTTPVFVPEESDSVSLNKILYILTPVFASLPVARNRTSLLLMSAVNVINGSFPVYTSLYVVIKASVPL